VLIGIVTVDDALDVAEEVATRNSSCLAVRSSTGHARITRSGW
jgi:Mg/Co/Ni transporter MgtE